MDKSEGQTTKDYMDRTNSLHNHHSAPADLDQEVEQLDVLTHEG